MGGAGAVAAGVICYNRLVRNPEPYYPSEIHKVSRLEHLGDYQLRLWFTNGTVGEWDFSWVAAETGPMLQPFKSPDFFAQVAISRGALEWPNGYDWCADALYRDMFAGGAFPPEAPNP